MEDIISKVFLLYENNEWETILELKDISKCDCARKLLWVWPSKSNLEYIQQTVQDFGLKGVTSIGCGTGLFEWLLHKSARIPVEGFEVNKEWWTSKYCSPKFIQHIYPKCPPQKNSIKKDNALLFCYFNNRSAFDSYISVYEGKLVFIIGPGAGRGTHTEPEPFKPNFKGNWELYNFQEVKDTKDFIAAYIRVVY